MFFTNRGSLATSSSDLVPTVNPHHPHRLVSRRPSHRREPGKSRRAARHATRTVYCGQTSLGDSARRWRQRPRGPACSRERGRSRKRPSQIGQIGPGADLESALHDSGDMAPAIPGRLRPCAGRAALKNRARVMLGTCPHGPVPGRCVARASGERPWHSQYSGLALDGTR